MAMRQVVCIWDHCSGRTLRCVYDISKKKVVSHTVVQGRGQVTNGMGMPILWIGGRQAAAIVAIKASGGGACSRVTDSQQDQMIAHSQATSSVALNETVNYTSAVFGSHPSPC
jgi:hypothetical protein